MRTILSAAAMVLLVTFLSLAAVPRGQGHGDATYASIDGKHLKGYVAELTAMSRRYRDHGHLQAHPESGAVDAADRHGTLLALGSRDVGHHSCKRSRRGDARVRQDRDGHWSGRAEGSAEDQLTMSDSPTLGERTRL